MSKKKPRLWPPVTDFGAQGAKLFDNHTHLPLRDGDYVADSAGVRLDALAQVERAVQSGVSRMVVSACDLAEVRRLRAEAARVSDPAYAPLRFAVAIHPNDAPRHAGILETGPDNVAQTRTEYQQVPLADAIREVEQAAREVPGVVAIGESGLDYFRTAEAGREVQKEAFAQHIELAKSLDLPLQIHDREAHADCIEVLLRSGAPRRTVFHCFSGDRQMAQTLAANGWYASFAGNVTYPANTGLRQGFLALPPELVLIETDAPYLTPAPYRGCPNASYLVGHTAAFLAELSKVSLQDFAAQTYRNGVEVYGTD